MIHPFSYFKLITTSVCLTFLLCFAANASNTADELGIRSTENSVAFIDLATGERQLSPLYIDKSGNDETNNGTIDQPFLTLRKAIQRAYASGRSTINVGAGTYSASDEFATGGRLRISGHPKLLIRKTPDTGGKVIINAGFRVQNGSSVIFRGIDFVQNGNMQGLPQIYVENSSVAIDDSNASYSSGDVGFLRLVNSWGNIRANAGNNVFINYSNFDGTSAIVEADYGSYLFIAGNRTDKTSVKVLTGSTEGIGVYLTGSSLYASNLTVQGVGNQGIGLVLNRASHGRILGHPDQSLSWFFVYLSGQVRVQQNNVGLRVLSGGDIKYSDEVESLLHSNTHNTLTPAQPENIIKAY